MEAIDVNTPLPTTFHPNLCPNQPHDKQRLFLSLTCQEAFFGGAAGGGKSAALLMAALQCVSVPGYAALILRKDLQRLALPGGLIPRSHHWLADSGAKWNAQRRTWTFPNEEGPPATLSFGYLNTEFDKYRYASSEFQYIAFDELTEIREDDYLFLFSRLRGPKDLQVPLRVRSASNPGNIGHEWVKQRFVREWTPDGPLPAGMYEKNGILYCDDRAFVPSLIADNPSLDGQVYLQSLMHLPPLERERLARGDWSVQEDGIFRREWLRDFLLADQQFELLRPGGQLLVVIPQRVCRRFATVDPAGTSADIEQAARSGPRSYSVIQIWDQPATHDLSRFLLFRDQIREQVSINGLCDLIRKAHSAWKPQRIWIEDEKLGHAVKDALPGLPIDLVRTLGRDKALRAAPLANKMERGEVFLPKYNCAWRPTFESELLAWTGRPRQRSDQIDAAAYAAIISSQHDPKPVRIQSIVNR
jgi:phage terminase large subunit-like protein